MTYDIEKDIERVKSAVLNELWGKHKPSEQSLEEVAEEITRAALNASEAVKMVREMEWQPIETAPRDGTPVLILTNYGKMATAYSRERKVSDKDGSEYGWIDYMRPQHGYGSVTHWMPLPTPPKEGE